MRPRPEQLLCFLLDTTVIFVMVCISATLAYAQEETDVVRPAQSVPTSGFCVNKLSGAMRLTLDEAGIARPCHKNEFPIALATLEAMASGSPAPTPLASPDPSPTPSPVANGAPMVVDVTGKVVGPLVGTTYGGQANLVLLKASGMPIEVLVSDIGFVDEATTGGYAGFTEYFASSDCSGQPMVEVGHTLDVRNDEGRPLVANPLVEVPQQLSLVYQSPGLFQTTGPYVYNQTVYFAVPPFEDGFVPSSAETFSLGNDPAVSNPSLCVAESNPVFHAVGPLATLNLNSLGLTPPFHAQ